MNCTYRCEIKLVESVEVVQSPKSTYNLPAQCYVYRNTVAEMKQHTKCKHALHHTASSLSLSLPSQLLVVVRVVAGWSIPADFGKSWW